MDCFLINNPQCPICNLEYCYIPFLSARSDKLFARRARLPELAAIGN